MLLKLIWLASSVGLKIRIWKPCGCKHTVNIKSGATSVLNNKKTHKNHRVATGTHFKLLPHISVISIEINCLHFSLNDLSTVVSPSWIRWIHPIGMDPHTDLVLEAELNMHMIFKADFGSDLFKWTFLVLRPDHYLTFNTMPTGDLVPCATSPPTAMIMKTYMMNLLFSSTSV